MVEQRRAPHLRRAPEAHDEQLTLDASQRAVLEYRGRLLRVLGAAGTGRTTVAVELLAARVLSAQALAEHCVILSASRRAASELRQRVTARIGRTTSEPLARTAQSLAFGILHREAVLRGEPRPVLITGPEQDVILKELLDGHTRGEGIAPGWPEHVRPALATRGFRMELRDLLMRAVELGVDPPRLMELGLANDRPEWVSAARVLEEYLDVSAFARAGGVDPAGVQRAAADLMDTDPAVAARVAEKIRLVVVDDAQELTSAGEALLRALYRCGCDLVLIGDPDSAVQTFRGADPGFLAQRWASLASPVDSEPSTIVLDTAYRQGPTLTEVTRAVSSRIAVLAAGAQRQTRAALGRECDGEIVEVAQTRSLAQESALVAHRLRRAHLDEGLSWDETVVITRARSAAARLRRALSAGGVPVASDEDAVPVRDEAAARPLLAMLDLACVLARDPEAAIAPDLVVDLLTSPLGGVDSVHLRRIRRALRHVELADGGGRSSDELLVEALLNPLRLRSLALDLAEGDAPPEISGGDLAPVRRLGQSLLAGVQAASWDSDRHRWGRGVDAETVLWAIWSALGVSGPWRRAALAGGWRGARADRDLDAVVALFAAAAGFVDRLPLAGPDAFVDHLRSQEVAADTLVPGGQQGQRVRVLTPQQAAGGQWRFVVIAGVQEGVWPDLRLRGSLLGSEHLVDVVRGRHRTWRDAQASVRHDETRLLHVAVSRASERLLITCVSNDEEQPSQYIDLIDPLGEQFAPDGTWIDASRPVTDPGGPVTLPGLVGALRQELSRPCGPEPDEAQRDAASVLAMLAREQVDGAAPTQWWSLRQISSTRALLPEDATVTISPSRLETFTECALRWLLTSRGGEAGSAQPAVVGQFVHDLAAALPDDTSLEEVVAAVEDGWGQLGMPAGWISDRERRRVHEMARRLVDYWRQAGEQGWRRAAVEEPFEVSIGRALLTGRVDRLEADDSGLCRVIDYKTGSTPGKVDQHPQLAAYQLAVEEGGFSAGSDSGGAALVRLGKAATLKNPPVMQAAFDDEQRSWARDLVDSAAVGMAGTQFSATLNDRCGYCAVSSSCPVRPEGKSL